MRPRRKTAELVGELEETLLYGEPATAAELRQVLGLSERHFRQVLKAQRDKAREPGAQIKPILCYRDPHSSEYVYFLAEMADELVAQAFTRREIDIIGRLNALTADARIYYGDNHLIPKILQGTVAAVEALLVGSD